ncbi:uncharacterized protein LOC128990083 [Macrosteles quadrilineatus]|uniref:uncharacterized protein LOC128990083 n=1 Tax=Macrosteles quadrilineatus TaxID=74068 RepID=UPI0023E2E190|nr:uncharacterized protein LOC128990083 [Macrosteles quadrilineatus]
MLPAVQKKFFISQVLGKFSPHVSSLMVNPQLDPSQVDNPSPCMVNIFNPSGSRATGFKRRRKKNPEDKKVKPDSNVKMIKTVIKTEVEDSCDSGLVIDIGPEVKSKEVPSVQVQRVKRKYTKRKHKESTLGVNVQNTPNTSLMCALPVRVEDIKVENDLDISNITQPKTELPDESTEAGETSNKIECGNTKNKKPKVDKNELPLKPKRKYVKRKLVRKKYKKREPKQKPPKDEIVLPEVVGTDNNEPEPEPMNEEEMEIDLWIELEDDSILTNEEVDNFFNGIDDPDHLFSELGIVMENQELPELFNNP